MVKDQIPRLPFGYIDSKYAFLNFCQWLKFILLVIPHRVSDSVGTFESKVWSCVPLQEPYMHIAYEYQLHRTTMPRSGEGDLWLNYEGDPKIRLQGVAQSPKFGKGVWVKHVQRPSF